MKSMDHEISNREETTNEIPNQKSNNSFFLAQLALKTLVFGFSLAGIIIMVTSKQTINYLGFMKMTATYSFSAAFKFNVIVNSVVCGLVWLSVILVIYMNCPKSNPRNYFYLLVLDVVSLLLLLSGSSAAVAIGLVGRSGQSQMVSIPICEFVPQFCNKITVSIGSSAVAVICSFVLTIMAAYKLKSYT